MYITAEGEGRNYRVFVDDIEVTERCYAADDEKGIAWCYIMDDEKCIIGEREYKGNVIFKKIKE